MTATHPLPALAFRRRLLGGLFPVPWAKFSDTFALHPRLTGLLRVRGADERTTNEVSGFISRVSAHSAAVMEDYWFDVAIAQAMSPTRWEVLVRQAVEAGLIVEVTGRGNRRRFKLIEDEQLLHIRYRDDVQWDKQRDKDRRNLDLTMPVLARDGDCCRYCGVVVNWNDRKSGRGGTFDHRAPGQPATIDTYVVSCRTCNSKRLDNPNADLEVPLRPAPAVPYFSPSGKTRERLDAFYGPSARPSPDTAASLARPSPDTAASLARPGGDTAASLARPGGDTAATGPGRGNRIRDGSPDIRGGNPGRDGTGFGSGSGGVGSDSAVPEGEVSAARRRGGRARRGPES